MKTSIYLFCLLICISMTLQTQAQQNKTKQKKDTSEDVFDLGGLLGESENTEGKSIDLGKIMDAMESEDAANLNKKAEKMFEGMEGMTGEGGNGIPDLNGAKSFLQRLMNNSNLPASEKANFSKMLQTMQQMAPSSMEYIEAISQDGKLERKGVLLEGLSEEEFNKQKALIDYLYTSEENPNATKADRRRKFDKYIDSFGGAEATEEQRNVMFKIFEAERNGADKPYTDIKFTENGKQVSLKERMEKSAKETRDELRENHRKMKNKYANMSFEEFQKEFEMSAPPEYQREKDKFVRELYREVQNNGGDMLKAIFIVTERMKKSKNQIKRTR